MIVLIGPSGSGKTTLEQALIERGYKRAISCTTRTPRKGEKHGLNYFFMSENDFKENILKGHMAEFSLYGDHLYGLPLSEISENAVAVVEPNGAKALKAQKNLNVCVCYLACPEHIRKERMLSRGDTLEQIENRLLLDYKLFNDVSTYADIILNTTDPIEDNVEYICNFGKGKKE